MKNKSDTYLSELLSKRGAAFCIAFALFQVFLWMSFVSPTDPPVGVQIAPVALSARTVTLLSLALFSGAIVWDRKKRRKPLSTMKKFRYGLCIFAAILLIAFDAIDGSWDGRISGIGLLLTCLTTGAIGALAYAEFGSFFSTIGAARLQICIVYYLASAILATPLQILAFFSGHLIRQAILIGFIVALCPMLDLLKRAWGNDYKQQNVGRSNPKTGDNKVPKKFIISLFVLGFSLGTMQRLFTMLSKTAYNSFDINPLTSTGSTLAALIALFAIFVLRMNFDKLAYYIGFPLIALGATIASVGGTYFLGYVFSYAGYQFSILVFWILSIYLSAHIKDASKWIFALLCFASALGQALGCALVDLGALAMQKELSSLLSFFIMLSSLILSGTTKSSNSWEIVQPGSNEETNYLRQACSFIAKQDFLTSREEDVLLLLAQGHKRKSIAEKLFLSENTVKTHISSVYRKLGVHNQQDLINKVEERCLRLEKEGRGITMRDFDSSHEDPVKK